MPPFQGQRDRQMWEAVIRAGYVSPKTISQVAREASQEGYDGDLGSLLVERRLITQEQFDRLLTHIEGGGAIEDPISGDEKEEESIAATMDLGAETLLDSEMETMLGEDSEGPGTGELPKFELPPASEAETIREVPPSAAVSGPSHPPAAAASSASVSQGISRSAMAESVSKARRMSSDDFERLRRVASGYTESLIGVNLGGYRIEDRLGSGGMGDVYRATQIALNREVALKVLPPHLGNNPGFIERFYREARTLGTFTHTNIVQVYDIGEAGGVHFFTMEKVAGHTLKDLVDTSETVLPEVCTNLLKQSLRGLSRALKAGIIHRDIKPGNILVSEEGDVKIVDFGLAEAVEESGEFKSQTVVGTPLYISPEQASGETLTFRTDMYSLGATFFHLLTGQPPFRGKTAFETTQMHVTAELPNPSDLNPAIPPALAGIIVKMMAKDPAHRFSSYEELFKAVESFELAAGIIKSPSDFLADSLMAIGDHTVQSVWQKIGFMVIVGTCLALMAIGIHHTLESQRLQNWIGVLGDVGTVFFGAAILLITYVAMARRRIVPVIGQLRDWMFGHIICALISFFLVTIHSGNFFAWFWSPKFGALRQGLRKNIYPDREVFDIIPFVPFLNSILFFIVIVSGLVGATIWRDIVRQVTVERIQMGKGAPPQDTRMTLTVFSQTAFKYWRMLHYPLAISLTAMTVLHIVTILWYRGV